jgi:hypothetical protein
MNLHFDQQSSVFCCNQHIVIQLESKIFSNIAIPLKTCYVTQYLKSLVENEIFNKISYMDP